ncbi:MAG TPA: hypothetical protein DCO72_02265 [Ruminococcus sp.]|nr:hypothetical protein [Ruminococcus sp.]
MPVWVQFTSAFVAVITAGIFGKAWIPFLQKFRFYDDNKSNFSSQNQTASNEKQNDDIQEHVRPTMCGVLLLVGCTASMVVTFNLCDGRHVFDRTSKILSEQRTLTEIVYFYALALGIWGIITDITAIKRNGVRIPFGQLFGSVIATSFVVCRYLVNAPVLYVLLTAVAMAVGWAFMQNLDRETDGITITVGSVQLLALTVLFLKQNQYYFAILSLCGAGANMGCMIWNVHPAKCRLGNVGSGWTAGIVTGLCAVYGDWKTGLLLMAVYLVNVLPALNPKLKQTLLSMMEQGNMKPWQRIALFSGFTAFCGVMCAL